MNDCTFQQVLRQNLRWFSSQHRKTLFLRGFILKPKERVENLLKNCNRDFQNISPFQRLASFYAIITGNFERLQYVEVGILYFPYKTTLSESNVKTNRTGSTK